MSDEDNFTLLHDAADYNSASCIRVLLGVAPHLLDAVTNHNSTPLMYAVRNNNRDAAKMFLRAGEDVRAKNMFDHTVFHFAPNEEMLEILNQLQLVSGMF